jgi:hypothetical protein
VSKYVTPDLESDLIQSLDIKDKVRNNDSYAQNLYAALCNNDFQKRDLWPMLKDDLWHCSWRYAGGIIADIRGTGDYLDWYCSGIGDGLGNGDSDGIKGYVPEGFVSEEIEHDLYNINWLVIKE